MSHINMRLDLSCHLFLPVAGARCNRVTGVGTHVVELSPRVHQVHPQDTNRDCDSLHNRNLSDLDHHRVSNRNLNVFDSHPTFVPHVDGSCGRECVHAE